MAIYNVVLYNIDPFGVFSTTIGSIASYTGPASPTGTATITDSDGHIEQAATESATADVSINATTSTGAVVYAEDVWTVRDTFTGEEFEIASLRVDSGGASGYYTLSEQPLIAGRIYETVDYDGSPDFASGDDVFTFSDYAAPDVGPLDGTVDGTSGNDVIDSSYLGDTHGDQIDNYDNISVVKTALDLNWDTEGADGTDISAGISQDTGGIQVDVAFTDTSSGTNSTFQTETTGTNYIGSGETYDANSALQISGAGGIGDTSTTTIDFSANGGSGFEDYVTDVTFRLSDVDDSTWQDILTISAIDPDGNPVAVTVTPGGSDTIGGTSAAPTITGNGGSDAPIDVGGSVLVSIDGPITQLVITYSNGGADAQFVNITDIQYNAVNSPGANQDLVYGGDGDDFIDAGLANDTLFGDAGNDTLVAGSGDDTLSGGADADIFQLDDGFGNDIITGGETGTDQDVVDATNLTAGVTVSMTGAEAGSITDSVSTGTFTEIENFNLTSLSDTYDGTASTTAQTIIGNAGSDNITGGSGNDSISGGDDADFIFINDNFSSDSIAGGEGGADTDTLDASGLTNAATVVLIGTETGTLTDGSDTATFSEIETFVLTDQADSYNSAATSSDATVYGGTGGDALVGGSGADTFFGGADDDLLDGGAGSDVFDGGDGSDLLHGASGDDTLSGGADADIFILEDGSGTDTIFGGETTTSGGVDGDFIDIGTATNSINLTFTGDEAGSITNSTDTATFQGIESFSLSNQSDTVDASASDAAVTLFANAGDDTIIGSTAADVIDTGAGSDTINAGAGSDTITAGDGQDTILLTDAYGADTINAGSGGTDEDTLDGGNLSDALTILLTGDEAGTAFNGTDTATFSEIENFVLTGNNDTFNATAATSIGATVDAGAGDDSILGSGFADSLTGGAGQDTIDGGDGIDTIDAGDDADTVILNNDFKADTISGGEGTSSGGTDNDTLDASSLSLAVNVILSSDETGIINDGVDIASFTGFETYILTDGGDAFDGQLASSEGATVFGGLGIDSLIGTDVADSLSGGAGQDFIDGGTGDDTISTGDDADAILLNDNFGNDIISAGDGTTSGGTDSDTLDASALSSGVDITLTADEAGTATVGADTATFDGIEIFELSANNDSFDGSGATTLGARITAGAGDDNITGTDAIDTIFGGIGDDTLDGGQGADTINAGDDADTILLSDGFGADTIIGGENVSVSIDFDTLNASNLTSSVTVTLTSDETGTATNGSDTATYSEIEAYVLSDHDDTFDASASSTLAISVDGGAGNDTLIGTDFADTLTGGDGQDTITGGDGADTISAGAGNDTLHIRHGDTVTGGDGDDLFLVGSLSGGSATINIAGGEGDEIGGDTLNFQFKIYDFSDIAYGGGDNSSGTATLKDGSFLTFSEIENIFVCFTYGTNIMTNLGDRPIETLKIGDKVITRDHGMQKIRWIGSRKMRVQGNTAPIVFTRGTFKNTRDLIVSPQHRMLFTGNQAELMFGQSEVLVPAKHLLSNDGVYQMVDGYVEYFHILFSQHEIIYAEGAASESYHPGDYSIDEIGAASREEIFTIFPELRSSPNTYGPTARTCLKAHEGNLLRLN